MAGKTVSGTPRKASIFGESFNVASDVDITFGPSVSKETQATSGAPNIKITKENPDITGFTLKCTLEQAQRLDGWAADGREGIIVIELASKEKASSVCEINYQGYTTADGVATVDLFPVDGGSWALL